LRAGGLFQTRGGDRRHELCDAFPRGVGEQAAIAFDLAGEVQSPRREPGEDVGRSRMTKAQLEDTIDTRPGFNPPP